MQPERAEILRSITRILEQDGYITKEEAVGIMELIQEPIGHFIHLINHRRKNHGAAACGYI